MTELSAAIKQLRKKTGLSTKVFAERLGLSDSSVYLWESGDTMPSEGNLEIIQREFGVNLTPLKADAVINGPADKGAVPEQVRPAPKRSKPKRRPIVAPPAGNAGIASLTAEMRSLCDRIDARLKALREAL